jgi:hypothetical protein
LALIRQLEGLIEAHERQWVERLVVRSGERLKTGRQYSEGIRKLLKAGS